MPLARVSTLSSRLPSTALAPRLSTVARACSELYARALEKQRFLGAGGQGLGPDEGDDVVCAVVAQKLADEVSTHKTRASRDENALRQALHRADY